MKVYKNPFVSRESYFVKTGVGHSYIESPKSKGYIVELVGGKWEVREGWGEKLLESYSLDAAAKSAGGSAERW